MHLPASLSLSLSLSFSFSYSHLLHTLTHTNMYITCTTAQLITQPPSDITAALGTNATFSCRGNGDIIWEIGGTQVQTELFVELFANEKVYVPLSTVSVSELIMTATEMNNFTRTIQCLVDPGIGVGEVVESDPVRLLVYGELVITVASTTCTLRGNFG